MAGTIVYYLFYEVKMLLGSEYPEDYMLKAYRFTKKSVEGGKA
jgi:hypothetical protein